MSQPRPDEPAALVRTRDRDRYLAALLAPEPARGHLLALYGVDIELGDVAEKVSEPLLGEMRLQWWKDAIGAMAHGAPSGNPMADSLLPAIAYGKLPIAALQQLADARRFDLYGELMRAEDELLAYCGETFGIVTQLACLILGAGSDRHSGTAAGHAGVIAGVLWILENFGRHAALGRVLIPGDVLARHEVSAQSLLQGVAGAGLAGVRAELTALVEARIAALNDELARLDVALRPAFAHLASARARLSRLQDSTQMLQPPRTLSPLYRQWKIWRFNMTGRI